MSPIYGHVSKLFSESEFQDKGNKQTKKKNPQNLTVFLARTDSENKIILYYTGKGENGQNCQH